MNTDSFDEITIEFANKREEELFAFAMVGERASQFFTSEIGRYILGRAAQEIDDIKEQILKTPAWRKRRITLLQQRAKAAKAGIQWLQEAVNEGEYAHQELVRMRRED